MAFRSLRAATHRTGGDRPRLVPHGSPGSGGDGRRPGSSGLIGAGRAPFFDDLQKSHLADAYEGAALGSESSARAKSRLELGGGALAKVRSGRRVAMATRSWSRLVALAIAVVLFGAACSGGDAETLSTTTAPGRSSASASTIPAPTQATTTSSPASGGQSLEDEIIARYIGYWDARFAANRGTPNPDDPALREFATGAQLESVLAETQANLDQGLAFRRAAHPADIQRVSVVEVHGDEAVVQECVVSDGVIIRRDSGEIVNDDVTTHNVRGEMQRVEGEWRVSAAELVQRWEGVAGCAHAS